ncbi:MAG: nucleotidyltransferase family protein [Planctomycetes bacterium]|nr:nucleotidyltransferase family protein [Planctomycetota bacterium]
MGELRGAVVLAAGAGTRMRREGADAGLSEEQRRAAHSGAKAMMPLGDRPFLDHVLHGLAEAGIREVCLVVAPDHEAMRAHYETLRPTRLRLEFAVQESPKGTAHALLSAEAWAGDGEFLLINGDNHYPGAALRALVELHGPGLAAFDAQTLLADGMPAEEKAARLLAFSDVRFDDSGTLISIVEKPPYTPNWVSMNAWRFGPAIFQACHAIDPSPRGEWELPSAVTYSQEQLQQQYRAIPSAGPVLDLSGRGDVRWVQEALGSSEVRL